MARVLVRDPDGNEFEVGEEWLTRFPEDGLVRVDDDKRPATKPVATAAAPATQWGQQNSYSPTN